MDTKKVLIGIAALVILFLGYCKYKGKDPKDVINGFLGKSDGNSQGTGNETANDPGNETPKGTNPASPSVYSIAASPYYPMYIMKSMNTLQTGCKKYGSWSYTYIADMTNGGSDTFDLRISDTRAKELAERCLELVTEMMMTPDPFTLDLAQKFEKMTRNELLFCWLYIYYMGYTVTDANNGEYVLGSMREISDNSLQNNRENASIYIKLINKYADEFDAEAGINTKD